jgi:hypothetical protein
MSRRWDGEQRVKHQPKTIKAPHTTTTTMASPAAKASICWGVTAVRSRETSLMKREEGLIRGSTSYPNLGMKMARTGRANK